jgi:hypothetical protein
MRVFNGIYTIRNRSTGEHRTFRVKTQPDDSNFAPGKRVVGLLIGPDNGSNYRRFAFVDDNGIHVWTKCRSTRPGRKSDYEYYAMALWGLTSPNDNEATRAWHQKYDIQVAKHCVRCNRLLTHPESLLTGIGPDCAGRGSNSPVIDPARPAPAESGRRRPRRASRERPSTAGAIEVVTQDQIPASVRETMRQIDEAEAAEAARVAALAELPDEPDELDDPRYYVEDNPGLYAPAPRPIR